MTFIQIQNISHHHRSTNHRRSIIFSLNNKFLIIKLLSISFVLIVLFYIIIDIFLIENNLFDSILSTDDFDNRNYDSYHQNFDIYDDVPVDIVYTWVNGSDPLLQKSLYEHSKRLFIENLLKQCTNESMILCHQDCLRLPIIIVKPAINESKIHLDNVRTIVHDRNHSLIFLNDLKFVDDYDHDCVRLLDGKIYKFSSLYLPLLTNNSINNDNLMIIKFNSKTLILVTLKDSAHLDDNLEFYCKLSNHGTNYQLFFIKNNENQYNQSAVLDALIMNENLFNNDKSTTTAINDNNNEIENIQMNRFYDNDELKYSLRSVHRFASSWIRNIYIVTNGQIPKWLNIEHPRIRIITHQEIFINQSHLPTFSSSAIESNIHRIPNLSKYFLYFNDDIMLGKPIYLDDFLTKSRGYRIYLSWPVPNCASGCPLNWLNDGFCDKTCNTSKCLWDGGDCLNDTIINNQQQQQQQHRQSINLDGNRRKFNVQYERDKQYYCSMNCLENWLGDQSCDQVCNNTNCAYDMGDCGVDNFPESFYQISINYNTTTNRYYYYPIESRIVYLNFTQFFNEFNDENLRSINRPFPINIIDINYNELINNNSVIYSAVYNEKYQILTILFNNQKQIENRIHFNVTMMLMKKQFNLNIIIYSSNNITTINELNIDQSSSSMTDLNSMIDDEKQKYIRMINQYNYTNIKHLSCDDLENSFKHISTINDHDEMKNFINKLKLLYKQSICEMDKNLNDTLSKYFLSNDNNNNNDDDGYHYKSRKLLDTYGDSLIYVNHLYNRRFGIEQRKVPAHMAHFIDRDIMYRLHRNFPDEFLQTSSSKIRNSYDMQLAFSYYYFLMSEIKQLNFNEIIEENNFDVDHSGTLNSNELQTLILKLYGHKNQMNASEIFEKNLQECCSSCMMNAINNNSNNSMTMKQTEFELNIEILGECTTIRNDMIEKFGKIKRNKYEIIDSDADVAFKMLRSNRTLLEHELNDLRINRKKFICLNDNFNHYNNNNNNDDDDNGEIESLNNILKNFYESLFPNKSPYELMDNVENPYLFIDQYNRWKSKSNQWLSFNIFISFFLFIILLFSLLLLISLFIIKYNDRNRFKF